MVGAGIIPRLAIAAGAAEGFLDFCKPFFGADLADAVEVFDGLAVMGHGGVGVGAGVVAGEAGAIGAALEVFGGGAIADGAGAADAFSFTGFAGGGGEVERHLKGDGFEVLRVVFLGGDFKGALLAVEAAVGEHVGVEGGYSHSMVPGGLEVMS